MRLLILGINYAPEHTGIAPYTTALAHHLASEHEVTVITGVPHYPDWQRQDAFGKWRTDEREGKLRLIRLQHFVPRSPTVIKRAVYELTWAARAAAAGMQIPADVVIAVVPSLFGAQAARLIARRQRVPYGVIIQDIMGTAAAQGGVKGSSSVVGVITAVERSVLRNAAAITTIHSRLGSELKRLAGRDDPTTIIHNWTHVDEASRSRPDARIHFGWRNDEVIALHSGNMGSKQNLEVVIDAARLAAQRAPHVTFVLAGGGSQRKRLGAYAAGCPNVRFLSGVDNCDYTDLLTSADVLLINERPGMTEMSLPSKLTSYMFAARPIVAATDACSATGDFVRASGGGLLTPAGDADALLDGVLDVADDEMRANKLGRIGRDFASEHLSKERALTAYSEWVAGLCARRD